MIPVFFFGTEVVLTNLCSYGFGYRGAGCVGEGNRVRGGVGGVSRSFWNDGESVAVLLILVIGSKIDQIPTLKPQDCRGHPLVYCLLVAAVAIAGKVVRYQCNLFGGL